MSTGLPPALHVYDRRDYGRTRLSMDFRQLRYFVTLFEEGSVTKAARRLGVVQPALSMQIRKLEEEYQTKLFERTSRGVTPTAIGIEFYTKAILILNDAREASTFLRDSGDKVLGDLVIGVMPSISSSILAPTINEFLGKHTEVRLRVMEAYSDSLTETLLSGGVDFAFINGDTRSKDIGYLDVYVDYLVLLRRNDPDIQGSTFRASDLQQLKLALPSVRQGMRRTVDSLFSSVPTPEPDIEVDSLNAVLELVSTSDYCSILPSLAVRSAVAAGRIKALKLVEPEFPHSVVVAFNPSHPPSLAGRIFIDMLRKKSAEVLDR